MFKRLAAAAGLTLVALLGVAPVSGAVQSSSDHSSVSSVDSGSTIEARRAIIDWD